MAREDSMTDNPAYDQTSPLNQVSQGEQQKSPVTDSTINNIYAMPTEPVATIDTSRNPVYGIESRPHRSTIRHVQNPVYGDPMDKSTDANVYSSPKQPPTQSTSNDSGNTGYSYAMVNTGTMASSTTGVSTEFEVLVGHKYAMVDKSASDECEVTSAYNQLKHEQSSCTAHQSQQQSAARLAENEDLGYSALT